MKNLLHLIALIGMVFNASAQTTITGKVTDSVDGTPLVGVNIIIKGTDGGTITDVEGNYSISTSSEKDVLVFSYIGYLSEEVAVLNQSEINISMSIDIQQMDEVIVIGYGSQRKDDITGAVAVVDVDQMSNTYSATLTDQLQGRVAGVAVNTSGKPGSIGDIKIRGASFFGGNNPLYVIDGILTGDSPNFNPGDVETVQVLKDASASAIYGNRAANGVIIITTKKGKKGDPKINLKATVGTQSIPSRIELGDNYNWARIVNAAHDNAEAPRVTKANEEFDPAINTNWQEELFDNSALTYDVNASVSAGGENSSVYFSVNNFRQDGAIKGPRFDRLSTRLNTEFKLGKRITIGEHLTIGFSKTDGVAGTVDPENDGDIITPFSAAFEMLPVIPVYDDSQPSGYGIGEIGKAQTWSENPIGVMDMFKNTTENTRILGDIYLNYEITDGLEYRFSLGLNTSFMNFKSYNEAGQIRMATPQFSGLSESRVETQGIFLENRLSYSKTWGKHNFSVMGAITEQTGREKVLTATSVGGYDNEVNFWQLSNSTGSISSGGYEYNSAIRSYLGRLTYDFNKKYYLSASVRHDGSSKFASENRWGTFPSISGGWNISNEDFFNVSKIDNLKLRGGYGVVGNASIGDYEYTTTIYRTAQGSDVWNPGVNYNLGPTSQSIIGATRSDELRNPDISWEELKETNIGLDLEMFDGQLFITGDYYFGELNDLLAQVPIPGTVGTTERTAPSINAVSMKRNGWEVAISYRKKSGVFQYAFTANISHSDNEITELGYGLTELAGTVSSKTTASIGNSVGKFFLLDYQGIYTAQEILDLPDDFTIQGEKPEVGDAKYRDVSGRDENGNLTGVPDGKISKDDDRIITGSPVPALQYGLNVDLMYKIFDCAIFIQGVSGRDVYNSYNALMTSEDFGHFTNYPSYYNPYVDGAGTDPRPHFFQGHGNNQESTRYLENGAYVRLKNVQIGATIPTKIFENLRLFISGQNLLTFTNYRGLDPEFEGDSVFTPGIDPRAYPNVRTFMLGLDVTF
jgi:TonB-linked SusC/RagA family outer membrane protein